MYHTYIRNINTTSVSGGGTDTVTVNLAQACSATLLPRGVTRGHQTDGQCQRNALPA